MFESFKKYNPFTILDELDTLSKKREKQWEHEHEVDVKEIERITTHCGKDFAIDLLLTRSLVHRNLSKKMQDAQWTDKYSVYEEYIKTIDEFHSDTKLDDNCTNFNTIQTNLTKYKNMFKKN